MTEEATITPAEMPQHSSQITIPENPTATDLSTNAHAALDTLKKASENEGHHYLHKILAWLKKEFTAIGTDIETELKKL